jgi:hypothetical protein
MIVYVLYNSDQGWIEGIFSSKEKVREYLSERSKNLKVDIGTDRLPSHSLEDLIQYWCYDGEFYNVTEWEIDGNQEIPVEGPCNFQPDRRCEDD